MKPRDSSAIAPTPRVKVCCIESAEEARQAVDLGASALGFVSHMPSGPGVIPESLIAEILPTVPPGIATFLLTSETSAAPIVAQQRRCPVDTIQLCDDVSPGEFAELRRALPEITLVQVIHVQNEGSLTEAISAAELADTLLLDSGCPGAEKRELGGTGRTHDWSISARIVEAVAVPVYLAGGLSSENVGPAVAAVRPYGVDLCTGVRSDGALDESKLRRFFAAVRSAN